MNSNIILWIQAVSTDEQPILTKNGTRVKNDDHAYSILCDQVTNVKSEYKELLDINGTCLYRISSNQYLLISNFKEKDVVGRRICFSANITSDNDDDIISIIQKEASLYNYSLPEQTCNEIVKAIKKRRFSNTQ